MVDSVEPLILVPDCPSPWSYIIFTSICIKKLKLWQQFSTSHCYALYNMKIYIIDGLHFGLHLVVGGEWKFSTMTRPRWRPSYWDKGLSALQLSSTVTIVQEGGFTSSELMKVYELERNVIFFKELLNSVLSSFRSFYCQSCGNWPNAPNRQY